MTDDQLEASQRVSKMLADGQTAAALKLVESLLVSFPGEPEIQTLAGDVYKAAGEHATSYRHYNSAADFYHRLGQSDKVLRVQHKILNLEPGLLDSSTQIRVRLLGLLVEAEDALLAGQNEKAVSAYQEAIRQFPNHTVTYQRLAAVFTGMGRQADAVEQYLTVARAFYSHLVTAKALPYFERVIELDPSHSEALESLLDCLAKEGRQADSERPIKAAMQRCLELGLNDNAGLLFARLAPEVQSDSTLLRAALLLQSGAVAQAEAIAAQALDAGGEQTQAWFKRMGRAALERGDAAAGETYFRWASPRVSAALPLAPAVPAQEIIQSEAFEVSPTVVAEAPGRESVEVTDDSLTLQKAGEMCLAEEMFEEAKQVFERLLRAEPERKELVEYLNQARAGLGLGAIIIPGMPVHPAVVASPRPIPAPPAPAPMPAPAVIAPPPRPIPAPPAPMPMPVVVAPPPRPIPAPPAPMPMPVVVAPSPRPIPAPPAPMRPMSPPVFSPVSKTVLKDTGSIITRTQYQIQLGEMLPPSDPAVDFDDQIIS